LKLLGTGIKIIQMDMKTKIIIYGDVSTSPFFMYS